MTITHALDPHAPAATAVGTGRTSVVVLAGRGEDPATFEALTFRLALDGHAVAVAGPDEPPAALAEHRLPGRPFVLLGSDTGALRALTAAASPALRPDGVVLFGLPLLYRPSAGRPLTEPPPHTLPALPILLVHGEQDQVSPLSLVSVLARVTPEAWLTAVPGGHQVPTGPGRRLAAASTLVFLETLAHAGPGRRQTGETTTGGSRR